MSRFIFFKKGLRDGFPIFLGYLSVSFTFGIAAKNAGISSLQAVLISATNLTSAGQFAALDIIATSATYFEMAFTQLVINLRYCLMSSALSQKLAQKMPFWHRFIMAFGVTDEIFGVSVTVEDKLSPFYSYGLMGAAIPGWTLGTLLGVISGNLLPARAISALSVALYGMFIAIIIPLTLIRKEITNTFIKSFLYYVPFVTLAVMTFPAILESTASIWSALAGFITAVVLAYFGRSLFQVSIAACVMVFVVELFI